MPFALSRPGRAVVAAVVLAASFTAGAAQAEPTQEQAVLAAMERDLGLDAAAARARLAAERTAMGAERAVRSRVGPGKLGGAWFDAARGALVVAVTDPAAAAAVRGLGVETTLVALSQSTLDSTKARLDAAVATKPAAVPGWYVDVTTNSVVVKHRGPGEAARAWVRGAGVTGGVRFEQTWEQPRLAIDVVGGNRYWTSQYGCSVGFAVQGGFITAGHCGKVGETTTQPSGRFAGSSFPVDDMAFVRTDAGNTLIGAVNNYSGGRVAVEGSREAPVGSSICRSGGTTGWHCGTIRSRNATVDYGSQGKVYEAIETTACGEPGDSGGSAISGGQAQGVTSGAAGDCRGGAATTWYQPVPEILTRYGVTLLTTDGGGDPPGECGADRYSGSLSARQSAVQPTSGYYQAAAGTHRGCLTGPSGADFDLYLERWTGSGWAAAASGTSAAADEEVEYSGQAGYYRWRVHAYSGTGAYTLLAAKP
ncbi:S1 family peptidase [Actinokineospora sp. UTMC 2448]|uniref:S1 family peptidase n=1 Tax=Actinokineospora sp. UTMC 2448 TaxID=2268449 RepID=UPI0021646B39|nr:S1 family peptidase [Actinokineospora sp. UTMC 2448]UVS79108.1 Alpha-lytic protease precursor [Actinokineospora sp. UTMC 2448]